MRYFQIPFLCLALGLVVSARAQFAPRSPESITIKVIQTEEPVFPLTLTNTPVLAGEVSIAIDVDQNGQLTDYLVTGYSRKEFADSALKALRKWRFEPPRFRGEPWAMVQELHFEYSRSGVVVSLSGIEALNSMMDDLTKGRYAFRTCTLRELDRIPTPIQVVSPAASAAASKEGARSITVEFYIDEEGHVRLPSVKQEEAANTDASNALAAVRQWRFEPPTRNGRPVLVIAQQQFNFMSKAESPKQK